ncbi:MAG: hypothetical protein Q4A12_08515, partial [Eubacteriales bacterium]|nr:hypothetical protein [Eubacteriales bacterium]
MKTIKKIISALLCMLILISVFMTAPVTASTEIEYSFEEAGVRYLEIDDSSLCIVGVNKEALPEEVVIPAFINDKTVTQIGERAFFNTPIKSITLPETVTVIGEYA